MAIERRNFSSLDEPVSSALIWQPPNRRVISIALTIVGVGIIFMGYFQSWNLAVLFGIGCVLGRFVSCTFWVHVSVSKFLTVPTKRGHSCSNGNDSHCKHTFSSIVNAW